jgi:hypothetical protein
VREARQLMKQYMRLKVKSNKSNRNEPPRRALSAI